MRTLMLLRHAQAISMTMDLSDKERSLTDQGKEDAVNLFETLQKEGNLPDIILCSSALRTKQTAKIFEEQAPKIQIIYRDDLYNASTGMIYETAKSVNSTKKSVMIIAHNPGIYDFVRFLLGDTDPQTLEQIMSGYPPCTLSMYECPCDDWSMLMPGSCHLKTIY